jgi:hypothetical protein
MSTHYEPILCGTDHFTVNTNEYLGILSSHYQTNTLYQIGDTQIFIHPSSLLEELGRVEQSTTEDVHPSMGSRYWERQGLQVTLCESSRAPTRDFTRPCYAYTIEGLSL